MGGRGSSSGMSNSRRIYGTEYRTLMQSGNIKFISVNEGSNNAPMETMTKGRVYVTIDTNTNQPKYITYYDKNNKRSKQIDLRHYHNVNGMLEKPHVHKGYEHNERGDYKPSIKESKMIDRVLKIWYNKNYK